jgi:hypothetical protein
MVTIMKRIILIISFLTAFAFQVVPQNVEVPFTLEDRDRIMRTEEKVESLRKEMNARFEGMEARFIGMEARFIGMEARFDGIEGRFDGIEGRFEGMEAKLTANNSKFEPLYWMIGLLFALMLFMLGYMIWDRRTALHPIQEKSYKHDERLNRLENITREQAKRDPIFAEVLRAAGLL